MARPEVAGDMRFIEEGAALSELADIRKQLHGIQQSQAVTPNVSRVD